MFKATWMSVAAGAALTIVLAGATAARGDVSLSIQPSRADYLPGGSVDFGVVLTGATELAGYQIVIEIADANTGKAGGAADAFWLVDLVSPAMDPCGLNLATRPADAAYVFGANNGPATRQSRSDTLAPPAYGIGLYDYAWDNANGVIYAAATDPEKQVLGTFRVETSEEFTGDMELTFDATQLFVTDPQGDPIPGFDAQDYDTESLLVPMVPEPATAVLLLAASAAWLRRRRRS